jgi:hypothetical protein
MLLEDDGREGLNDPLLEAGGGKASMCILGRLQVQEAKHALGQRDESQGEDDEEEEGADDDNSSLVP